MANPHIFTYGYETRFQPGVSGNPKGRPKGSRNLSTIVKELLFDEQLADKMLKTKPSYWQHLPDKNFANALVTVMIIKALGGDIKAANWLRVTGYGNKIEPDNQEREFRPPVIFDMRTNEELVMVPKSIANNLSNTK